MRRLTLLALTLVFSLLGLGDSWYLAQHELTDTALSCGLGTAALSGCNIVAQSPYSRLFGIPLGVYGLVFYGIALLIVLTLYAGETRRKLQLLFAVGSIGVLCSLYFEGLQVFVIKALCVYCLGSFLLSIAIFAAAWALLKRRPVTPPVM